jgi:membrane protein DedA with SNARE-associated domain
MINSFIHLIENFLVPYGATGVFAATVLEEVIAPIPSALVMLTSGFFLIQESAFSFSVFQKVFLLIALPGALGITIGSLVVYGLGYISGKPALLRWSSWLGFSWGDVEKIEAKFSKGYTDEILLFVFRAIPIIPSVVISGFCGFIRLPLFEYILFTFLGTIVRAFILGVIGWRVGQFYHEIAGHIDTFENSILILIGVSTAFFIGYRFFKRRRQKPVL